MAGSDNRLDAIWNTPSPQTRRDYLDDILRRLDALETHAKQQEQVNRITQQLLERLQPKDE